ncbi:MAG: LPS export ABC transporter ATP-binding protein [Acidobacteriia bacterium]|jgi:lipopolysaccharide export system ATP-binding protein|nr:LPS export ABC transporter ATP-binding protein [Terriglobia bacterium]
MQILSTVDLSKSFKGRKVVDDVSLRIAQGEVIGLLGPNGAGKTTTFYIIVGLTTPDAGQVLLDGADITHLPMYLRARNGISYLPQEPSIFRKLTVEENIMAVLETLPRTPAQRRERLEELIEELGLQQVRRSAGYLLSGGERRRVEIARSLVISPSFILLDEPFSGIDPLTVLDIQKIIVQLKESGIGVLVTDHNVRETLRVTDRAYIINNGRIFRAGTPEELGNDAEVRMIYLGDSFRLAV